MKYVKELCLDSKIIELGSWQTKSSDVLDDFSYKNKSPDNHSLIVFTSGTSGPPKGVIVTDRMILAAAAGTALASECVYDDNFLLWEPLYHIGGVQGLIAIGLRLCDVVFEAIFTVRPSLVDIAQRSVAISNIV